ncbi:MAG: rod shape-determining protein MreC [Spirochaetales bacterium]|nr:rod shape-determining protein MreC [Spirochaetales bacterium]
MGLSTDNFRFRPLAIGTNVVSYLQKGFQRTGQWFGETLGSIQKLQKVNEENRRLREKLEEFQKFQRELTILREENQRLNELLQMQSSSNFNLQAAGIIAKDPGNIFSSFTIDKGASDGVSRNTPIVAFQNGTQSLVGKVVSVSEHSAQVLPLYDASSYVAARFARTRYEGLVQGKGVDSSELVMRYVQKRVKQEISYGDLVITSGMNSLYPAGIHIGRVTGITAKEYETSLTIDLEALVDFSRLEYVFFLVQDKKE